MKAFSSIYAIYPNDVISSMYWSLTRQQSHSRLDLIEESIVTLIFPILSLKSVKLETTISLLLFSHTRFQFTRGNQDLVKNGKLRYAMFLTLTPKHPTNPNPFYLYSIYFDEIA